MTLALILLSVLCSSAAHLALKLGALRIDAGNALGLIDKAQLAAGQPLLWLGLCLHGAALLLWIAALTKAPLSFAYPFIALGFVLIALASYWWLAEPLNAWRIAGMTLIVAGVFCVAKS